MKNDNAGYVSFFLVLKVILNIDLNFTDLPPRYYYTFKITLSATIGFEKKIMHSKIKQSLNCNRIDFYFLSS